MSNLESVKTLMLRNAKKIERKEKGGKRV